MPIRTIVSLLFPLVVGLSSCTQDVNSQLIEAARNDQTESIQALRALKWMRRTRRV
jgi:hypothetical protein